MYRKFLVLLVVLSLFAIKPAFPAWKGDVNSDNKIDIVDVVKTLGWLINGNIPIIVSVKQYDMNYNGELDINDVILIMKTVLSMRSRYDIDYVPPTTDPEKARLLRFNIGDFRDYIGNGDIYLMDNKDKVYHFSPTLHEEIVGSVDSPNNQSLLILKSTYVRLYNSQLSTIVRYKVINQDKNNTVNVFGVGDGEYADRNINWVVGPSDSFTFMPGLVLTGYNETNTLIMNDGSIVTQELKAIGYESVTICNGKVKPSVKYQYRILDKNNKVLEDDYIWICSTVGVTKYIQQLYDYDNRMIYKYSLKLSNPEI